jgi:ubiquinone/menaquinone biosynthesis C-methylase UbiE
MRATTPAWAKTKETLLPLARTIVETFRRAGESISVVRLDGIRRRGESHNDPECQVRGRECHHLTFSQGIRDIRAALDHFEHSEEFRPSTVVLVTFSGAAIEARRALAAETRGRVGGWVSVVGAADLKSGLRTVSGGVDYIGGGERGVHFGIQRILGIEVDIDRVAADALEHQMAYLEDARCDLEKLDLPITWIQGRYDAWIDPLRVQQMLACGPPERRRVIEVPTGHQLRSSREALETFQLIAQEIGRITLGRQIPPAAPDLADVERRRRAERGRLPKSKVDLRAFWRDYLLGRDRRLGMELLIATQPYRELMEAQLEALELRPGDRVADLGAGTGAFPLHLLARGGEPGGLRIHEVDYVREGLERARGQLAAEAGGRLGLDFLSCDLDVSQGAFRVPMADASYDRVIASLLLNYVKDPSSLLAEVRRLLRPGGRLVLSTLRRDADISRIYRDVSAELYAGGALERLGEQAARHLDASLHEFLNEAARLLDLEEEGIFHFWDADELVRQLTAAGFAAVQTRAAFGDPPQAIVASAVRP